MGLETMGLGAVLAFSAGNTIGTINRTRGAFASLRTSISNVGKGASRIGGAIGGAALAFAPAAAGIALAGTEAASFEHQMSAVQAVAGATKAELDMLTTTAKRLGVTTQFSATEAGEGMELLARAGFSAAETINAVPGVMNAAAAEGIPLARATDIVASSLRAMGESADQSTRYADVLAKASAITNSDIIGLGEGLKYVTPSARSLGITFEQTTAALGRLADAGLKNTLAGTGLSMMFQRMSAPTKKARDLMNQLKISMVFAEDGTLDFVGTLKNVSAGISKLSRKSKVGALAEIFGARAAKAASILADSATEEGDRNIAEIIKKLNAARGAAEDMAATRLDNFLGQIKLAKNALSGLGIEVFGAFLKAGTPLLKTAVKGLQQVVLALQDIRSMSNEGPPRWLSQEGAGVFYEIALGINDAIEDVLGFIERARNAFTSMFSVIDPDGARSIARFASTAVMLMGVLAPVLGGFVGIGLMIKSVLIPVIGGAVTMFTGLAGILMGPVGIALGSIVALIFAYQRSNETFGQTALRLWGEVKAAVIDFYNTALKPLWEGIQQGIAPAFEDLRNAWMSVAQEVKKAWLDITEIFGEGTSRMQVDWLEVGRTIGAVVGALFTGIGHVVQLVVHAVRRYIGIVTGFVDGVRKLFDGQIVMGLAKIIEAMTDAVIAPIRNVVLAVVSLADKVGGSKLVPDFLRAFGEKGIKIRKTENNDVTTTAVVDATSDQKIATQQPPVVNVAPSKLPDVKVDIKNKLQVDGRDLAIATSKAQQMFHERAGFRATPYQRRAMVEYGAVVVKSGS